MKNPDVMGCPVARAAAIFGSRWTALILRDLMINNVCRYQELLDSLTGIPPTTLSQKLKMLEAGGIVERRFYDEHPPRAEYILTEKGRSLGPALRAMREWGNKYPEPVKPAAGRSPQRGRSAVISARGGR